MATFTFTLNSVTQNGIPKVLSATVYDYTCAIASSAGGTSGTVRFKIPPGVESVAVPWRGVATVSINPTVVIGPTFTLGTATFQDHQYASGTAAAPATALGAILTAVAGKAWATDMFVNITLAATDTACTLNFQVLCHGYGGL